MAACAGQLVERLPAGALFALVVDEASFRRRFAGLRDRLLQRRAAWSDSARRARPPAGVRRSRDAARRRRGGRAARRIRRHAGARRRRRREQPAGAEPMTAARPLRRGSAEVRAAGYPMTDPQIVSLSLVSHTNAGKTTLARTLLGRDIGEVRDAPHVTEFAEVHTMLKRPQGDRLQLWDTPGFGDSVRLMRRLRQSANPIGWFISEVWDRWRDRAVLVRAAGAEERARRGRRAALRRQRRRDAGGGRLRRARDGAARLDRQAGHRAAEPARRAGRAARPPMSSAGAASSRALAPRARCCRSTRSRAAGSRRWCCSTRSSDVLDGDAAARRDGAAARGLAARSASRPSTPRWRSSPTASRASPRRTRSSAKAPSLAARLRGVGAAIGLGRGGADDATARGAGRARRSASTPRCAPARRR